jgi:hypothetical protein
MFVVIYAVSLSICVFITSAESDCLYDTLLDPSNINLCVCVCVCVCMRAYAGMCACVHGMSRK